MATRAAQAERSATGERAARFFASTPAPRAALRTDSNREAPTFEGKGPTRSFLRRAWEDRRWRRGVAGAAGVAGGGSAATAIACRVAGASSRRLPRSTAAACVLVRVPPPRRGPAAAPSRARARGVECAAAARLARGGVERAGGARAGGAREAVVDAVVLLVLLARVLEP